MAQRRLASYEEGFRAAGLPLFDEDFSASTDVFNRAAPLLALVFVAEMLGAIKLEWSLLANMAAAIAGLLILLGAGRSSISPAGARWARSPHTSIVPS